MLITVSKNISCWM